MNCADTEGIFRIIQSIPSPKAEPFKRLVGENRFRKSKRNKKILNWLPKEQELSL